jgi:hypothetical protein
MSPLVFNARPRYDLRPCLTPGHHPAHEGREPLIEHVHDLWTLHGVMSNVTAALWRNDFGLELRIEHPGELIESRYR